MARATFAWFGASRRERVQYCVTTTCPKCGREHITVFKLRHISDSFFRKLGEGYRYARHFDFRRLRWCSNSLQHPKW
jgi:hypothetical protein